MKKILGGLVLSALLASPAAAADLRRPMPVKAPAPVATLYSWTGCYIGGHAGWAWGKKRVYDSAGIEIVDFEHDVDGFLIGGQVGCNLWQSDRWVFGIEGQAAWADIGGDVPFDPAITAGPTGFRTDIDIIGSISARLGYAFGATGRTLLFVKGGAAFVHEQYSLTGVLPTQNFQSDENLRWGWMVGAGLEHAIGGNWSAKAEYNFNHFGKDSFEFCNGVPTCTTLEVRQHVHLVKFGVNYRFGGFGGPVVARY
jgi:outer membrane immunogenic protein